MRRFRIDQNTAIVYFLTNIIVEWLCVLCVFKEKRYSQIIIDSLEYCQEHKGLYLLGYVIMPNHVHLITSNTPDTFLSTIMRDFKRHTSRKIGNELEKANERLFLYIFKKASEKSSSKVRWKIWRDEFHPEAIYSEEWFYKKLEYMHNNPVRKGFVVHPEDWKYCSARNWTLEDDSIIRLNGEFLTGQKSRSILRSG